MAEYIEREELIARLQKVCVTDDTFGMGIQFGTENAINCIKEAPAADVVEVKHGKWYRHDKKIHGDTCYYCSECEKMALTDCGMVWELTPYCPFCGVKMDGKED